jgi:alpha-tubulin suppressor-like RCC1 family protein
VLLTDRRLTDRLPSDDSFFDNPPLMPFSLGFLSRADFAWLSPLVLIAVFALSAAGAFAQAPGNDSFAARTALSGTSITVNGTNVAATAESGEPAHADQTASKSVWWSWTAPQSGRVNLDTFGSAFDTVLAVYTGTSLGSLKAIAFNDESSAEDTSEVSFVVVGGVSYAIAVDGYDGASGAVTLHLDFKPTSDLYFADFESWGSGTNFLAGHEGWLTTSATIGTSGVMANATTNAHTAWLGYGATQESSVSVWRPIGYDPLAGNTSVVNFSVDLTLFDSTNGQRDSFWFTLYNLQGQPLGSIVFDNASGCIFRYNEQSYYNVGTFTRGAAYTLAVTMDFFNNVWSASLSGGYLFSGETINFLGRARSLGDLAISWVITTPGSPGNNYLLFDNYRVSVPSLPVAPNITTQPMDQTVIIGEMAIFTVTAAGAPEPQYRWWASSDGGATWNVVANALPYSYPADATLYVYSCTETMSGLVFRCVASNSVGPDAVSNSVRLTVIPRPPPTITTQPTSQTVYAGDAAVFSTAANRDGLPAFNWQVSIDGGATWSYTALESNTYASEGFILKIRQATMAMNMYRFRCVVSNGVLPDTISDVVTLTVVPPPGVVAVAAGRAHSLFVRADGTFWATGDNTAGQLGDGATVTRTSPVKVTTNVAACAAGDSHSLFLKTDGSLWGMGLNASGQLGDGTAAQRPAPVQISAGVVAIAAGSNHSLFLKSDGSLWAAGQNDHGQLGDGTTVNRRTPVQVATDVVALAGGGFHSLFIRADRSLWAMGLNTDGQLGDGTTVDRNNPVCVATDVQSVAAGANHSVFVKNDGTLWAMGRNDVGQLGDATTVNRSAPVQVATGVKAVWAGGGDTLFISLGGVLRSIGSNSDGQLGIGSGTSFCSSPNRVANNVAIAAAGGRHNLFVKNDGSLSAMGDNRMGQQGNAYYSTENCPAQVVLGTVSAPSAPASITAGDRGAMGVRLAWSPVTRAMWYEVWRSTDNASSGAVLIANNVPLSLFYDSSVIASTTYYYWVKAANPGGTSGFSPGGVGISAVAVGPIIVTSLTPQTFDAGTNVCLSAAAASNVSASYQWRKSGAAIAGATNATLVFDHVQPGDAGTYDVVVTNSVGSATSGAITLVVRDVARFVTPLLSRTATVGQSVSITATVAGAAPLTYQWKHNGQAIAGATTAMLTMANVSLADGGWYEVTVTNSLVSAWSVFSLQVAPIHGGVVAWGSNGIGETTVPGTGSDVVAIAAGSYFSMALKAAGTVVEWGNISDEQKPIPVGLSDVVAIAAGGSHRLALRANGTVVAWGLNTDGQADVPPGLTNVVAVAAGNGHSLALQSDGTVVAWGNDYYGQCNVPGGLGHITAISARGNYSLALKADGTVVAWGGNSYQQSSVPAGLSGVKSVVAGGMLAAALKADGSVVAWGTGAPNALNGLTNIAGIAAGFGHELCLKTDGTVIGAGDSSYGQSIIPTGLTNVAAVAAGDYHNLALLQVMIPPSISIQPISHASQSDDGTNFTLQSTGAGLSYQWQRLAVGSSTWVNLGETEIYSDVTTVMLVVANTNYAMAGDQFRCVVTNAIGSVISGAATLAVHPPSPVDYDHWTWRNPLPQGLTLNGVAWSGSLFVAVGNYGTILTSVDGTAWTLRTSGTTNDLFGATWGGGQFVAVGRSGTILTSSDGLIWAARTSGTFNLLKCVTWGGNQFVAVGDSGAIVTSSDGVLWTSRISSAVYGLQGIAWSGSRFVAIGNNAMILSSMDGVVWAAQSADIGGLQLLGVTWSGSQFLGIGASGTVVRSGDGVTWRSGSLGLGVISSFPLAVTWGGGQFVGVGDSGTIRTSADGVTWIDRASGTANTLRVVMWNGSQFVAVGDNGTIITSADGVTWASRTFGTSRMLYGMTRSGNQFVAVGDSGAIVTSADGVTWTTQTSGTTDYLLGVTWGGGQFVAVGGSGVIVTSWDGITWASQNSGTTNMLYGVNWCGNYYVAVGDSGTLLTSADGMTWAARVTNVQDSIRGVVRGGSQFVAVGGSGTILTSADGITWASRNSGTTNWLFRVAWGAGKFVAVGAGTILTSTDGMTWTSRPSGTNYPLYGVTWTGSEFVAVDGSGLILTSVDGIAWISRASGIASWLTGVIWGGDQVLAFGNKGTIIAARVVNFAPTIATQPVSQTVIQGQSITIPVLASGTPPFTYQWYKNTVAIPGATNATLTIDNGQISDGGNYTVTVTNNQGTTASGVAVLTVNPPVAPAIATQPKSQAAGAGQSVTFTVVATGSPAPTYQWSKDGTAITGATGASYTIASVQTSDAGSYTVVATNSAGSAPSNAALLTVLPAGTSATHAVVGAGYMAGGTVTITNTITCVGTATGMGWQVLLPDGWSFASGSDTPGQTKPAVGTTGLLEWDWTTIPASPVTFTYTLNVPANASGSQELAALAIVRLGGDPLQMLAKPDPLIVSQVLLQHSADTNCDWKLSLLELTRVIALYNTRNGTMRTGCYSVQPGSEDGFAPEPTRASSATVVLTRYHSADIDHNGKLSLVELTRVIELYNTRAGTTRTGQYHVQAGTEDGYAPGP